MLVHVARTMLAIVESAALCMFVAAQAVLALHGVHRLLMVWSVWRRRPTPLRISPSGTWPRVTIQLPLYNEPRVAERLIDAVAAVRYPADRLDIQVLDDSTDATRRIAASAVRRHRARGLDIRHLHRRRRDGFKAGALADGLRSARGEFVAVFDADFVPPPDFLTRVVPHFADPGVGMVQARWSHLNRERSPLTVAQAVLLDAHFLVEHEVRQREGWFFNFNGSAGVWRRTCIESSGGWTHDTLTEDLDLSYRAQLAGWRFVFDASVLAPAELPVHVAALKSQQDRWVRGSIQTARKLLPAVTGSRRAARVRLEAWFHLTANAVYPAVLALSLLLVPVLLVRNELPAGAWVAVPIGWVLLGTLPVCAFLVLGQRRAGRRGWRVARDVAWAMVLSAGLSLTNACAVFAGLRREPGEWRRTPKTGDEGAGRLAATRPRASTILPEAALAVYLAAMALVAFRLERLDALPLLILMVSGCALMLMSESLRERPKMALAGTRARDLLRAA
jgi:cellulose synthase/poly-beta-1,6-N-acetylglucosamine synthase-like glycosyltransferase